MSTADFSEWSFRILSPLTKLRVTRTDGLEWLMVDDATKKKFNYELKKKTLHLFVAYGHWAESEHRRGCLSAY